MNTNINSIFQIIPEELLNPSDYTLKIFKKGDIIARQGDIISVLHLLNKGSVRTEMISESGTILSVEKINAPCPLAPAFLFAETNLFPVEVIALEACELMLIPKNTVLKLLSSDIDFLSKFMTLNADRTQFLSDRLQNLSIKTIKGKLANYILQQYKNKVFQLDKNQTQLAEYFGVTRPSLARSFSEMVEEGAIERKGNILNISKLQEYLVG